MQMESRRVRRLRPEPVPLVLSQGTKLSGHALGRPGLCQTLRKAGSDRLRAGRNFTTFGADQSSGQLVVKIILPSFAPRRLFEPDSTARMDTRTLQVLCEIAADAQIYAGQRLTATFM